MKSIVRQLRPSGYARFAQGLAYGLLAFLLSSNAWALSSKAMEGTFASPKQVTMMMYADETECAVDGGRWNDGVCVLDVADEVRISRKDKTLAISVEILGTNFHQCLFEAKARRAGHRTLIAREKVTHFADGKTTNAVCVVKVRFTGRDSVSVSNNGMCDEFCGANVGLDIEKALRKN